MSGTSSRQVVIRGLQDELFLRVVHPITQANIAISGSNHEVSLYNASGGLVETVTSGASFSVSDTNLLTLKHMFTSSTYPLNDYYKAVWRVHVSGSGGGSVFREFVTYFSVVLRRFTSQLSTTEMSARHPYLAPQIPSGQSLAIFLQRAWERISLTLWKRMDIYPGNIFQPEDFSLAQEYLTLGEFFLSIAYSADPRDEDIKKHELYTSKGLQLLDVAASNIAADQGQHGVYTSQDKRNYQNIRAMR